jgi:LacI family transcriptional regulator
LGYRPNAAARNLRRRRGQTWALIISDIENPFFTTVARGVEDVAHANGFSLLLCNTDEQDAKELEYVRVAIQEQSAGVILAPHSASSPVTELSKVSIPFVVIDRSINGDVDTVRVDSYLGARKATRHLIEQGWIAPACITGPTDAPTAMERLAGYRAEMEEAGLASIERYVHEDFKVEGGRRAVLELFADGSQRPDSLVIGNAALALGALKELPRVGLTVGVDLGVVSFDDAPWASVVTPPLSVIAQPAYEIGKQSAELLISRIGHDVSEPRQIVLGTELIARSSSLRPVG